VAQQDKAWLAGRLLPLPALRARQPLPVALLVPELLALRRPTLLAVALAPLLALDLSPRAAQPVEPARRRRERLPRVDQARAERPSLRAVPRERRRRRLVESRRSRALAELVPWLAVALRVQPARRLAAISGTS